MVDIKGWKVVKPPKRSWLGTDSIGRALLILSTVFILALFGILLYTITTIQNQKLDSVLVDLAGRQRMLSQRLMNEILLTSQGIPADYRFTQKMLNQTLEALLVGGQAVVNPESGYTAVLPPPPSQEIRQALGEQQTLMAEFMQRADTFLKTPFDHPQYSLELDGLLALNARLIEVANKAVKLYSRNSQKKISNMIVWESLIGILVIPFGILMTRQVKLANQELEHEIQERSRIERALRYRIEIENLVTNLSTQFISLEAKDLDTEINRALEAIGTFGGVDRSYVFIFEDDGMTMNNTHEWCQTGIEPQKTKLQGLRMQDIPWFAERLISGPFFQISRVASLPLEASAEKEEFQRQQIQSLVIVPMALRGKLFGFLGFDSVQHEKTWSEEDIRLLQMAGEIFVNGFERQRVEENLRKSEAAKVEAFRQSDALKTALLSLVSHELRTPLTAIKASIAGLIELSRQDASKVQQEFLQGINQEIDFLNGLVDNLLDMSKVEAGTLVPHREWHLLEDLVEGAIRRLEMPLKSRSLQVILGEKISPIFVDGMEIQQVLINLLDNAIKYSFPGSLIRIVGEMTPNQVEVRVSSEGEGIPQEELVSIFNRFYRLKGPRTRLIRGTGLGLAICKGMVEAHGGRIWAESQNRIVTISFTLPTPDAPPMINFDREGSKRSTMALGSRILAVDDERQIRRSLQINLEAKGYEVLTAGTGEEALQIMSHRLPDLALVDLLLPGMDGIDLTRQIRETYQIPIIILSAIGEEAKKIEALEGGADDYVTKPFSMEELTARIRSVLRRTSSIYGTDPVFTFGNLQVDFESRNVRIRDKVVKLTPTEYDLLKYLIQNSGKVLTHGTILRAIWGAGYSEQAQYLRVFIGNLRKKLEKNTARPQYILTDPGVGYRFATDFDEDEKTP